MFGQTQWFQRSSGSRLRPKKWQGWVYLAAWGATLALPFVALVLRQQVAESLVWLFTATGLLAWDVRQLRRAICEELAGRDGRAGRDGQAGSVLYIGDDGTCDYGS